MIDLCFDAVSDKGRGYANLSSYRPRPFTPQWRDFDQHWPYTVPLRLCLYLDHANIPYRSWTISLAPSGSWYPICFSWFDFNLDYVSLIPVQAKHRIISGDIKILFYYHEGDNPVLIRQRLDSMCQTHSIPLDHTLFVSANTAARHLPRCIYFDDFECWFWVLNHAQPAVLPNGLPEKHFTALSRVNKSWRACVMSDLYDLGCLEHSLWSYASDMAMQDQLHDNPIQCQDRWSGIQRFLDQGPYRCDSMDRDQHNDHHWVNQSLYHGSRVHLVLETHFDADGSGGSFITEKTYKCLKYGQPFLIIGTVNSLEVLKSHGYRTFDHVFDHSYDGEADNTKRWNMLLSEISRIKNKTSEVWSACQADCAYNQQLFQHRLDISVNSLLQELSCHQ